jgi:hypothetical protein
VHNCLASAQPKSCKKRLPFGRCAPYAPPLRVGLSRPLAAQKWLAYGQAIYQGADKPRRRHSTAGAHIKAPRLLKDRQKRFSSEKQGCPITCARLERRWWLKGRKS